MKRYTIYRCPEKCDHHTKLKEHLLIGATTAASIEEATEEILELIKIDLSSLEPDCFSQGNLDVITCSETSRSRRYQYYVVAAFVPDNELAPENLIREYGIMEIKE